jgi:phosphate uptake regulator
MRSHHFLTPMLVVLVLHTYSSTLQKWKKELQQLWSNTCEHVCSACESRKLELELHASSYTQKKKLATTPREADKSTRGQREREGPIRGRRSVDRKQAFSLKKSVTNHKIF